MSMMFWTTLSSFFALTLREAFVFPGLGEAPPREVLGVVTIGK